MDTRFAITEYPNAAALTAQLDALIKKPIYSINRAALKEYEQEYFEKKCAKSKEMITEAKEVIPGGVQHNLAFKQRATDFGISTATNTSISFRQAVLQSSVQTTMLLKKKSRNFLTIAVLQQVFSTHMSTSLLKKSASAFLQ